MSSARERRRLQMFARGEQRYRRLAAEGVSVHRENSQAQESRWDSTLESRLLNLAGRTEGASHISMHREVGDGQSLRLMRQRRKWVAV